MTTEAVPYASCDSSQCFNSAFYEIVPCGRWRNMPVVKACRGCVKKLAAAYTTESGEKGWAEVQPLRRPKTSEKTRNARRRVRGAAR